MVTTTKVIVNYYKMLHFLIKSWHGFLGGRPGKLDNLKCICWHSAIEKIENQRQIHRKRIRALSEQQSILHSERSVTI